MRLDLVQAEYVRDIHNHYLVLKGNDNRSEYGIKMLLNNKIQGIIKMELRCIDEMDLYYYNITSKKSLRSLYDNRAFHYLEIKNLMFTILSIIETSDEYLLSEHDFIIEPSYIYIDNETKSIELCHLVGFHENIKKQISCFIEYLMNKVDYKDEQAVLLVYAMYKQSKEEECTFEHLKKELNKKDREDLNLKEVYKSNEEGIITESHFNIKINNSKDNQTIKKDRPINNEHVINDKYDLKKDEAESGRSEKNMDQIRTIDHINGKKHNKQYSTDVGQGKRQDTSKDKGLFDSFNKLIINRLHISKLSPYLKHKSNISDTKNNRKQSISIDMDKEKEILYFPKSKYIFGGFSILSGIVLFLVLLSCGLLQSKFGTIEYTKLICVIVMILCIEVYIITKLFDKKSRLTKVVRSVVYLDDYKDIDEPSKFHVTNKGTKSSSKDVNDSCLISESLGLEEDETQILCSFSEGGDADDKTTILSELFVSKKYYLAPYNTCDSEDTKNLDKLPVYKFPFIIGKNKNQVDLCIPDTSVSRIHAKLLKSGEDVILIDLNSTNGTFINGIQLHENVPQIMKHDDIISIAKTSYQWYIE